LVIFWNSCRKSLPTNTYSDELSLIGIICHILYEENLGLGLPCVCVQFSVDLSVFSSAQSFQAPSIYHFISLLLFKILSKFLRSGQVLRRVIVARMSVGYHLPRQHILSGRDARGRFCAVTCASLPS